MSDDKILPTSWARIVDALVRGERVGRPLVSLGPTPRLLQELGLAAADLATVPAKIVRARREHPEVALEDWHRLPQLLSRPLAVVPSIRRDGSLLVVLVVRDAADLPVIVPIVPGTEGRSNIVLSMYGKTGGMTWIQRQLNYAAQETLPRYVSKGFAAALPQPGSANAIPSSPGPIPADGATKPDRDILRLGRKGNEPGDDA